MSVLKMITNVCKSVSDVSIVVVFYNAVFDFKGISFQSQLLPRNI